LGSRHISSCYCPIYTTKSGRRLSLKFNKESP
jgi:hypothetical protein